jgi:Outer membrane protein beta-barrel domain
VKKIALITGLLSVFIAPVAMAESTGKSYMAFDFGTARYSGVTLGAGTVVPGTYPNPGLVSIAFGHHYNEKMAAEVGLTKYGDSKLSSNGRSATITATSIHVAAVGSTPLDSAIELFGKFGIAYNHNSLKGSGDAAILSTSANHIGLIYGVGAQMHLIQDWDFHIQYVNFGEFGEFGNTGSPMKAAAVTTGVTFSF